MKLLFINPNSSAEMTRSIVGSARDILPEAEILGWTNHDGPPAIQGPEDGAAAVPGLLALLPAAKGEAVDVIVIACFDDTGLAEARAMAHCPVIGIGQAGYHVATLLGARFSVLTTLAVSVPVIEANIRDQGFGPACEVVRPSGLAVLEVEAGSPATLARLAEELQALETGEATAVVLGCAGMSAHLDRLQSGTRLTLVDGVRAAAGLALALRMTAPRAA